MKIRPVSAAIVVKDRKRAAKWYTTRQTFKPETGDEP